jgi:probable HAF family extracellular repeat protein
MPGSLVPGSCPWIGPADPKCYLGFATFTSQIQLTALGCPDPAVGRQWRLEPESGETPKGGCIEVIAFHTQCEIESDPVKITAVALDVHPPVVQLEYFESPIDGGGWMSGWRADSVVVTVTPGERCKDITVDAGTPPGMVVVTPEPCNPPSVPLCDDSATKTLKISDGLSAKNGATVTFKVSVGSCQKTFKVKIKYTVDHQLDSGGGGGTGGGGGPVRPDALEMSEDDPRVSPPSENWGPCSGGGLCILDPCSPENFPPALHQHQATWCWSEPANYQGGDLWFEETYSRPGRPKEQYDGPWSTLQGTVANGFFETQTTACVWQDFEYEPPGNPAQKSGDSKLIRVIFHPYMQVFNPYLGWQWADPGFDPTPPHLMGSEYGVARINLLFRLNQAGPATTSGGRVRLLFRGGLIERHLVNDGTQEVDVVQLSQFPPWTCPGVNSPGPQAYDVTCRCVPDGGEFCPPWTHECTISAGSHSLGWEIAVESALFHTDHYFQPEEPALLRWAPHDLPKKVVDSFRGWVYFEVFGERSSSVAEDVELVVAMQVTPRDTAPNWEDTSQTVWASLKLTVCDMGLIDVHGDEIHEVASFSHPSPVVTLDEIELQDILLDHNVAVVTISGTVTDAIADSVPGGAADIIEVYVGEDEQRIPVVKDLEEPTSTQRPFAFKGRFGPVSYRLPIAHGSNMVLVKAVNAIGNEGHDGIVIEAEIDLEALLEPPPAYQVHSLGTLGGSTSSALGVSTYGIAVGAASNAAGALQAVRFSSSGGLESLGTLGGATSTAQGQGPHGEVVGGADTSEGLKRPFLYKGGSMMDLGTLGGTQGIATAISDDGRVVGSAAKEDGDWHAFLWRDVDGNGAPDPGEMVDLGTHGGFYSAAWAVSRVGHLVAGDAEDAEGNIRGFLWNDRNDNGERDEGEWLDLGTLGGLHSFAYALTDEGHVVGEAETSSGQLHAFLFKDLNENGQADPGEMLDLGTLGGTRSIAFGVNGWGQVVGESRNAAGARRAVLWDATTGAIVDLNDRIPSGSGWVLRAARSISPAGHIAGEGLQSGVARGFVLTPQLPSAGITLVSVENLESTEAELVNPVRVIIKDLSVTPSTIDGLSAGFFGSYFPLKFEDGELQADRPFLGVARTVNLPLENVVDIRWVEWSTPVRYRDCRRDFFWAYTAQSPAAYMKYAAGTKVGHRVVSKWFSKNPGLQFEPKIMNYNPGLFGGSDTDGAHIAIGGYVVIDDSLYVNLDIGRQARTHPRKTFIISYMRNGQTKEERLRDNFMVVGIRVLILAVDGAGYQHVNDVIESSSTALSKVFVHNGDNRGESALAVLPTVTWTNWTGVFSGMAPSDHGIVGNAFFERERGVPVGTAWPFATANDHAFFGGPWYSPVRGDRRDMYRVASCAELNTRAFLAAGSVYDEVKAVVTDPVLTVSNFALYSRGALSRTFLWDDPWTARLGHDPQTAKFFDDRILRRRYDKPYLFADRSAAVIETVYLPGTDNVAHEIGGGNPKYPHWPSTPVGGDLLNAIKKHFSEVVEPAFQHRFDDLCNSGYLYSTVFVLTADHGLVAFVNTDLFNVVIEDAGGWEMQRIFEGPLPEVPYQFFTDRTLWRGDRDAWPTTGAVYSPSGGLAHM